METIRNNITEFPGMLLFSFLLILSGCEKNQAPVIQNINTSSTELEAGESISLNVSAIDPDGDELIYLWEASEGEITSDNYLNTATWISPIESGNYYCKVSINDGTEIVSDSLLLTVREDPVLQIDPPSLTIEPGQTNGSFNISNSGSGSLDWSLEPETNDGGLWINTITPNNGSTPGGGQTGISFNVDRSGLSGGQYTGKINVLSDGGNGSITIILEVNELLVSPLELDFGTIETSKKLTVRNGGSSLVDFSITASEDWLGTNPINGQAGETPQDIIVLVDRNGLDAGDYSGDLTVSSTVGDIVVEVVMEVRDDPLLFVNTSSLDFSTNIDTRSFFIQNRGGGTLNWNISESLNWITIDQSNGTTTSETDNVLITADRSVLTAGKHSGKITINSDGGTKEITVNVETIQGPILNLSTKTLDFSTSFNELTLSISNSGGQVLNWALSESLSWLSIRPVNGATTNETDDIQVVVDRTSLLSGRHTGEINITSNGGNDEVQVSIEISGTESEWLKYDDDAFEGYYDTDEKHHFFLTQFDRPADWKNFKISKIAISFNPLSARDNIELFCFSTQNVQGRYYPFQSLRNSVSLNPGGGWNEWNVDWTLSIERFCVGYRQIEEKAPLVHYDKTIVNERSFYVDTDSKGIHVLERNWAIRVFVEKSDGEPEPGQWLDVIIKPESNSKVDNSRFIENKN